MSYISQQKIDIKESFMRNLNYGKVLMGLESLDNNFAMNHGIVLSVQEFSGSITLSDNTISENKVLIPEAIFTNYQKFNQTAINFVVSDFKSTFENRDLLEFRIREAEIFGHDIHFFNYYDPIYYDADMQNYQSYAPIYLRNIKSKIEVKNNRFENNIGLHGGVMFVDHADA